MQKAIKWLALRGCRDRGQGRGAAGQGSGVLYWLRQDLRLHDNPALCAAAAAARKRGGKLTLVYVHSPEEDGEPLETGGWPSSLFFFSSGLGPLQVP